MRATSQDSTGPHKSGVAQAHLGTWSCGELLMSKMMHDDDDTNRVPVFPPFCRTWNLGFRRNKQTVCGDPRYCVLSI